MGLEPALSPRFIAYIRDYLMDRGVEPEPLFTECGIDIENIEEDALPVPMHKVAAACEAAAAVTGNSCVGLNMARNYHYESASVLILAMLAASSVEEGLICLCRYDQYIDSAIETRFLPNQNPVQFHAGLINLDGAKIDQLNEYLMAFTVQILNTATRQTMPVEKVWFQHSDNRNKRELEDFFQAPCVFGESENRLEFDRAFMKERFMTSNGLLYDILSDALKTYFAVSPDRHGFVEAVSREIIRADRNDPMSMEMVAAKLALSPRTLRRRLSSEGFTFQEVKNLATERRAKYYLISTSLSLSEISFELGYSELSAFSRAFRTRVGETPQTYREKLKQFI
ncbi:MAG: AraC family transcriptional regulator ligand-binding domain-containing protein [Halioglobus sp.]